MKDVHIAHVMVSFIPAKYRSYDVDCIRIMPESSASSTMTVDELSDAIDDLRVLLRDVTAERLAEISMEKS